MCPAIPQLKQVCRFIPWRLLDSFDDGKVDLQGRFLFVCCDFLACALSDVAGIFGLVLAHAFEFLLSGFISKNDVSTVGLSKTVLF